MNGVVEAEAEKGVPNFWLIAMKTNEMLANEVLDSIAFFGSCVFIDIKQIVKTVFVLVYICR